MALSRDYNKYASIVIPCIQFPRFRMCGLCFLICLAVNTQNKRVSKIPNVNSMMRVRHGALAKDLGIGCIVRSDDLQL